MQCKHCILAYVLYQSRLWFSDNLWCLLQFGSSRISELPESGKPETGKEDATIEGNGDGNGQVPPGQTEDEDGNIVNPGGHMPPALNRGDKGEKPDNPNKPDNPRTEDKTDKQANKANKGTHKVHLRRAEPHDHQRHRRYHDHLHLRHAGQKCKAAWLPYISMIGWMHQIYFGIQVSSHHLSQNDWKLDFVKKEVTSIWIKNRITSLLGIKVKVFYVSEDMEQVLWWNRIDGVECLTLEEWRASEHYDKYRNHGTSELG